MPNARERLAGLLQIAQPAVAPCIQLSAAAGELSLTVEGVGDVRFPISAQQARALLAVGAPAPFGRGEQTLTDVQVRDTCQVPVELVTAVWGDGLVKLLDDVRQHLALPEGSDLRPELHSMLVYGKGQFFAVHQDSEKHDDMIATLVLTLPAVHTGGELVIHHGTESRTHKGTKSAIGVVAFHADRHHEIRPVTSGHRVSLTYNLLAQHPALAEHPALAQPRPADAGESLAELAGCLAEHFSTRTPKTYRPSESDDAPARLVYLLDHEYTERGLAWSRLKGVDRQRAARLSAAARQAGCEVMLALCEVQETWDVDDSDSYYRRRRSYRYGVPDDKPSEADYELTYLIDSALGLTHWVDETGAAEDVSLSVSDDEWCTSTPSANLVPYSSEYEGYMGNYGNTLDRWYRRAAVVVWPAEQGFAVRGQASPMRAVEQLLTLATTGDLEDLERARAAAATLAPFWQTVPAPAPTAHFFTKTLLVAAALDDAGLARLLAGRFQVTNLHESQLTALVAVTDRYGKSWSRDLLRTWFANWQPWHAAGSPSLTSWLGTLPALCAKLAAGGTPGAATASTTMAGTASTATAANLVTLSWGWLDSALRAAIADPSPRQRDTSLTDLGPALSAVLTAAGTVGKPRLVDQVVDQVIEVGRKHGEAVLPCLRAALRDAAGLSAEARGAAGFDRLAAQCSAILSDRLERPARADDDWSLTLPRGCDCTLCQELATFLRASDEITHEWRRAQMGRTHLEDRLRRAELPVQPETRRSGSPHTLILTKKATMFDAERAARQSDRQDLGWLAQEWPRA